MYRDPEELEPDTGFQGPGVDSSWDMLPRKGRCRLPAPRPFARWSRIIRYTSIQTLVTRFLFSSLRQLLRSIDSESVRSANSRRS